MQLCTLLLLCVDMERLVYVCVLPLCVLLVDASFETNLRREENRYTIAG